MDFKDSIQSGSRFRQSCQPKHFFGVRSNLEGLLTCSYFGTIISFFGSMSLLEDTTEPTKVIYGNKCPIHHSIPLPFSLWSSPPQQAKLLFFCTLSVSKIPRWFVHSIHSPNPLNPIVTDWLVLATNSVEKARFQNNDDAIGFCQQPFREVTRGSLQGQIWSSWPSCRILAPGTSAFPDEKLAPLSLPERRSAFK